VKFYSPLAGFGVSSPSLPQFQERTLLSFSTVRDGDPLLPPVGVFRDASPLSPFRAMKRPTLPFFFPAERLFHSSWAFPVRYSEGRLLFFFFYLSFDIAPQLSFFSSPPFFPILRRIIFGSLSPSLLDRVFVKLTLRPSSLSIKKVMTFFPSFLSTALIAITLPFPPPRNDQAPLFFPSQRNGTSHPFS